jgi:SRSO17 transposase
MAPQSLNWTDELEHWLAPFLACLGHKAVAYVPALHCRTDRTGGRKSVQPMAKRLAPGEYDQLHHFVAEAIWDAAPLEAELLTRADRLVGGDQAVLVIDDRALPKKGSPIAAGLQV